jgi:hypothetical protein
MGKVRVNLVAYDAQAEVRNILNNLGVEVIPIFSPSSMVVLILPRFEFEGKISSEYIPSEYKNKVILAYKKRGSGEIGFYKTKVTFCPESQDLGLPSLFITGIPKSSQDAEEMLSGINKSSTDLKDNQDKVIPTKSVLVSPSNNILLLM